MTELVETLFGWCMPGVEANHPGCRDQYLSTFDGKLHRCSCECHGRASE